MGDQHRAFWVAQTATGQIVGFSGVRKGEVDNELEFAFVLPEYQGRGLGKKLLSEALGYLGDDKTITLDVAAHNKRAIELYQRLGFQLSSKSTAPLVLKSGKQIPWASMSKPGLD